MTRNRTAVAVASGDKFKISYAYCASNWCLSDASASMLLYRPSMVRAFDRLSVSIACSIADETTTYDGAGIRTAGHPNRPAAVRVQPYVRARLTNRSPPVPRPTTPRGEKN
jgi:hypothetical protein